MLKTKRCITNTFPEHVYYLLLIIIYFFYNYYNWTKDWCSDDYTGPKPGSESEVQAIIKTISDIRPLYGAIDFHSFGQRVFFPNGKQWITDHLNFNIESA